MTLKQVLVGIQALLDEPNLGSPANHDAYKMLRNSPKKYEENVKAFAARHKP